MDFTCQCVFISEWHVWRELKTLLRTQRSDAVVSVNVACKYVCGGVSEFLLEGVKRGHKCVVAYRVNHTFCQRGWTCLKRFEMNHSRRNESRGFIFLSCVSPKTRLWRLRCPCNWLILLEVVKGIVLPKAKRRIRILPSF